MNDKCSCEDQVSGITEEDQFYLTWGKETLKNNISLANATLSQLLTLCTALIGSSVYFLSDQVLPKWALLGTFFLLMTSLVAAIIGVFPRGSEVDLSSPSDIRTHKNLTLALKRRQIAFCVGPLLASLFFAVIGVIVKSLST